MKEFDNIIANFIFNQIKYSMINKIDLDFAYNVFVMNEEYEKCSILKELVDMNYFDNENKSNYNTLIKIVKMIEKSEDILLKIELKKMLLEAIDDVKNAYNEVEITIPPLKNIKNLEYLKNKI